MGTVGELPWVFSAWLSLPPVDTLHQPQFLMDRGIQISKSFSRWVEFTALALNLENSWLYYLGAKWYCKIFHSTLKLRKQAQKQGRWWFWGLQWGVLCSPAHNLVREKSSVFNDNDEASFSKVKYCACLLPAGALGIWILAQICLPWIHILLFLGEGGVKMKEKKKERKNLGESHAV